MNGDLVQCVLNNCKKGKIFLGRSAIEDRKLRISRSGLTCFANFRLTGTYICSLCSQFSQVGSKLHMSRNFQVNEGEKDEGHENDVFKTSLIGTLIIRSDSDVFPCFQIESNMNLLLSTSFIHIFWSVCLLGCLRIEYENTYATS